MATLEDLQRRVEELERKAQKTDGALQLAPHQQGPRPGWFRAARIEGTQMILDFSASQAGTSPLITVTDTAGIRRVEMGFLAANGISPQQYGLRANDSSGAPIFDSLGIIQALKILGTSSFFSGGTVGTNQSGFEVSDGQLNFSLTLDSVVMFFIMGTGKIGAGGISALITSNQDHGAGGWNLGLGTVTIANTNETPFTLVGLSNGVVTAGSHSINLQVTTGASTFTWIPQGGIMAISLGRAA
jgi:hypothetical protein